MFNGKKLTLKLYTISQTNYYVVYWYFMNIIFTFYKLLVVLRYYWNLSVTSVKYSSQYKVLFTQLKIDEDCCDLDGIRWRSTGSVEDRGDPAGIGWRSLEVVVGLSSGSSSSCRCSSPFSVEPPRTSSTCGVDESDSSIHQGALYSP